MLRDKKAVITGGSQGFGFEVAKTYISEGADVFLCARSARDVDRAIQDLDRHAGGAGRAFGTPADVSNPKDVCRLAEAVNKTWGMLDVLVCNAGVYGPKGAIDKVDWQEWSDAIAINLHGTVLCCREMLSLLRRSKRGRIIILSGGGATKPLPFLSAYAASKAAVVRFGETLAEELRGSGIDVNMVAPGALNTRLLDEVLAAGPDVVGDGFYQASLRQRSEGGTALTCGAGLCAYLASEESAGITGKLISAPWDPWRELQRFREDIDGTDIYTLRRIVPKDRGKNWG
jgi:NAD(P)-dependent dehydrogenase (short-subunit alcohol dehydrogenase family)